jgi:hypothetical protein
MPRSAPRRLVPLLAVMVAVLGLLGLAVTDEVSPPAGADAVPVEHIGTPHDDGADLALLAGETPVVVRVTVDHLRSAAHGAPLVTVAGAAFAGLAVARALVAALAAASMRPAPVVHVRRRGPPALVVV